MGHDTHFLERLSRGEARQTDLALMLYRDPALVGELLDRVEFPPETDRVAIALDDGSEGPHVIVARNGRFVTCLGKGMTIGPLPRISRARVEREAQAVAELRTARSQVVRIGAEDRAWRDLWLRVTTSGAELSREEYLELRSMAPLLREAFLRGSIEGPKRVRLLRGRLYANDLPQHREDLLRQYWFACWTLTHDVTLSLGPSDLRTMDADWTAKYIHSTMTMMLEVGFFPLIVRLLLMLAELGKPALPALKELCTGGYGRYRVAMATAALTSVAVRHPKLRAEVEKFLSRSSVKLGPVALKLLEHSRGPGQPPFAQAVEGRVTRLAADLEMELPASPEERQRLAAAFFANRPTHLDNADLGFLIQGLPWLASLELEDLYFAKEQAAFALPFHPESVEGHINAIRPLVVPQTKRNAPRTGRNEPCPCESGRKYKKCCGAPRAA